MPKANQLAVTAELHRDLLRADLVNVNSSAHAVELQLYVAADLLFFAGHFPGFPILPGVAQLKWAVDYANEFLGFDGAIKSIERLKFTYPIQPGMQVTLSIISDPIKKYANFRYHSQHLTFSQGRLVYA